MPAPLPMTGEIKPTVTNIFLSTIFLSFDLDMNNYNKHKVSWLQLSCAGNNKYIGSNFDYFLQQEGLLAEVEANAIKRVIACQIAELMKKQDLSKAAMAKKMKTSRSAIDRLLDPQNESVTLQTLIQPSCSNK